MITGYECFANCYSCIRVVKQDLPEASGSVYTNYRPAGHF